MDDFIYLLFWVGELQIYNFFLFLSGQCLSQKILGKVGFPFSSEIAIFWSQSDNVMGNNYQFSIREMGCILACGYCLLWACWKKILIYVDCWAELKGSKWFPFLFGPSLCLIVEDQELPTSTNSSECKFSDNFSIKIKQNLGGIWMGHFFKRTADDVLSGCH